MVILILCTLISFGLYIAAPAPYSYVFSMECLTVFLTAGFVMLRNNCRHTFIKFELFFTIAFFFTNIIYSVVYYPVNPYFFLFNLPFNEDYINKGLALSVLAYSTFCMGIYDKSTPCLRKKNFELRKYVEPRKWIYVMVVMYLPVLITAVLANAYVVDFTRSNINAILLFVFLYGIFAIFSNYDQSNGLKEFVSLSSSKLFFICICIYVLTYLYVGSRTNPLRMILLMVFCYSIFISDIDKKRLLAYMAAGSALMMVVSVFRARGAFDEESLTSFWDIGMDLTINNRSLYVLMEDADMHGINFGKTMLSSIAAIVPWGQSLLLNITGWKIEDINSASYVTNLYFSSASIKEELYGLGTNILGDIYIAFGLFGVIGYMYFLGRILRTLYRRMCRGSRVAVFLYAMIFIEVIYITRASSLEFLRNIAWGCLWFYFFNNIYKKKRL